MIFKQQAYRPYVKRKMTGADKAVVALVVAGWLLALAAAVGIMFMLSTHKAKAQFLSGSPPGTTQVIAVNTGTTGAISASIAPLNGDQWIYVCGFDVSFTNGATGGTIGPITLGSIFNTQTFTYQIPVQTSTSYNLHVVFTPCLLGNQGTAIFLNTTANANATAVDIQLYGYRQN